MYESAIADSEAWLTTSGRPATPSPRAAHVIGAGGGLSDFTMAYSGVGGGGGGGGSGGGGRGGLSRPLPPTRPPSMDGASGDFSRLGSLARATGGVAPATVRMVDGA